MKDSAGQQQHREETFKDCGRIILIEIPFVAFGGVGDLAHFLLPKDSEGTM